MREIRIKELKSIQMEMLKDIHSFCTLKNLRYSLAFGSLLGAIRHGGYIPWDDDIDIMMPRDDYDSFIKMYKNDIYKLSDMSVNPNYGLPFAKVEDSRTVMEEYAEGGSSYGVYIDVFPVDNVPDNYIKRRCFYFKKTILNMLFCLKTVKLNKERSLLKNTILLIGHFSLSLISIRLLAWKMSEMSSKYRGVKTSTVGIVAPADSRVEETIPACFFEDYIELPFENVKVMAIKEYDKYLSATYGDYLRLPPVEERVSHHIYKAWWKQ